MKRISIVAAAMAAMAMGAAPASASLPIPGQLDVASVTGGAGGDAGTGDVQVLNGNSAAVSLLGSAESEGGDTAAKSGDAYAGDGGDARGSGGGGKGRAEGGDGGSADTGNVQGGNGNSLAVSVGGKPERGSCGKCSRHEPGARSKGGHTYARSGEAYAGRGGRARAGKGKSKRCHRSRDKDERSGGSQGGDGGHAFTGNWQFLNGNSLALALFGDAWSEGGDTFAKSGDAYGGDGGDAGLL